MIARWARILATLATLLSGSSLGFAQGCPMCYNTAAAAKAGAIHALRSGIIVLLLPPLAMFIGIFVIAFRSRESSGDDGPERVALGAEPVTRYRNG